MRWSIAILATALVATVSAIPSPIGHQTVEERAALSYKQKALIHHNIHRVNHTAGNLTWNSHLASWAEQLAKRCNFAHNTTIGKGESGYGVGYGQNLAAGVPSTNITSTITDLWYGSEFNYYKAYGSEPNMDNFGNFGHFTQVVWNGTKQVGCYTTKGNECSSLKNAEGIQPWLTVCNYGPPGNYIGEFSTNVLKPLGNPVAKWNTGI